MKTRFLLKPVCVALINELINNIDSSKAYQKGNILPKRLKDNVDIRATVIHWDTKLKENFLLIWEKKT